MALYNAVEPALTSMRGACASYIYCERAVTDHVLVSRALAVFVLAVLAVLARRMWVASSGGVASRADGFKQLVDEAGGSPTGVDSNLLGRGEARPHEGSPIKNLDLDRSEEEAIRANGRQSSRRVSLSNAPGSAVFKPVDCAIL